jgi:ribonuclease J
LDKYIEYTEDEDLVDLSPKSLIRIGAVPDIKKIDHIRHQVKAICLGHAHLDHIGAVPYLGNKFDCSIHGSYFTIQVLKAIIADEKIELRNNLVAHKENCKFRVSKNITVEFINMTHSTPQTVLIAVHTKYGTVLYANDFKLDKAPVLGQKPNFRRLGRLKVRALILDSLYAPSSMKTPSESIAREMLKDVLLGVNSKGKAVVVTTFSSHIARLKSVVDVGKKLNRKIVFLGRSLAKYVQAAEEVGLVKFSDKVKILRYKSQINRFLKTLSRPEKYLLVVTGHQGEPKAVLSRMANGLFRFHPEDQVIFSCKVIPVPINFANRGKLERTLKDKHVRIFRDIHVSGHACREDHRDFINLVKPEHVIPAHGNIHMFNAMKDLALEMGYQENKIHLLDNGKPLVLK